MNIQDRIAKLEKELAELKGELEVVWTPRKGEIVKFSNDGVQWRTGKIVGYNYSKDYIDDDENVMYYEDDYGDNWNYCHPINDPMVIQLIPHVPGDPMPCSKDKDVITLHGNEFAEERYYTVGAAGEIHWDMCDSDSDVFCWAPLNED